MKILFLTENFPPESNAAATRVFERALYWVRDGHDVTILTCAPNFPAGKVFDGYRNRWRQVDTIEGIRVVRVKTFIAPNQGVLLRIIDFLSFMISAFIIGLFEKKPDLVAATSPQFFAAVGGWALSFVRRVPFVFELGDLWPASVVAVGAMKPNLALRLVERLELFLYHRSAAVAALTQSFKDDLVGRGVAAEKIAVVINGVDLPRYGPRPRDEGLERQLNLGNKCVIGYMGTHGMAHALQNVVEAAALLKEREDIAFLFVGPGAAREMLIALADEKQLTNILFMPRQPKEDMPRYWSLCDVALVHLRDDPVMQTVIPSKIFEAMGMGLPLLLAAPEGEASHIVIGEGAGVWVEAERPDLLADAVRRLADNHTERERLGQISHAAAPRYSRERQATDMISLFESAITCYYEQR